MSAPQFPILPHLLLTPSIVSHLLCGSLYAYPHFFLVFTRIYIYIHISFCCSSLIPETWISDSGPVFANSGANVTKQSMKTKSLSTNNQKCKKKQVQTSKQDWYSRPLWPFLKGTETKYVMKTKRVLISKEQKQILKRRRRRDAQRTRQETVLQ